MQGGVIQKINSIFGNCQHVSNANESEKQTSVGPILNGIVDYYIEMYKKDGMAISFNRFCYVIDKIPIIKICGVSIGDRVQQKRSFIAKCKKCGYYVFYNYNSKTVDISDGFDTDIGVREYITHFSTKNVLHNEEPITLEYCLDYFNREHAKKSQMCDNREVDYYWPVTKYFQQMADMLAEKRANIGCQTATQDVEIKNYVAFVLKNVKFSSYSYCQGDEDRIAKISDEYCKTYFTENIISVYVAFTTLFINGYRSENGIKALKNETNRKMLYQNARLSEIEEAFDTSRVTITKHVNKIMEKIETSKFAFVI